MLRVRSRSELLVLAGLVGLLVVVAAFSFSGGSGGSGTAPPSARPSALAFAQAYVSYLDGRLTGGRLAAASDQVEAVASSGGVIPARDRDGVLSLRRLNFSGVQRAPRAKASLIAGDRRHTLQAVFTLAYLGGRWQVTYLVPPDLSTLLAPPPPPGVVSPAAHRAAVRFALAYTALRDGAARRAPGGLPQIRQQIATGKDPLAGIPATRSVPRLVSLRALGQGTLTSVAVVVATGSRHRSFGFILQRGAGGWQVWQFPQSAP